MSLTVPFRSHRQLSPDDESAATGAPAEVERVKAASAQGDGPTPQAPGRWHSEEPDRGTAVRIGRIEFRSVAGYLLVWAVLLFLLQVLVFWVVHTTLHKRGVLDSVSAAAATVLGDPVPASGVLPALELEALLPWAVMAAGLLALLALLASLAVVLAHNCICALTGGPRVRIRKGASGAATRLPASPARDAPLSPRTGDRARRRPASPPGPRARPR